jgi:hypothetical protein
MKAIASYPSSGLQESYLIWVWQKRPHVNHSRMQDLFIVREAGPELLSDKFNTDELFSGG